MSELIGTNGQPLKISKKLHIILKTTSLVTPEKRGDAGGLKLHINVVFI